MLFKGLSIKLPSSSFVFFILALVALACPCNSTLAAVDLLYFMADPGISSIMLYWETATEINNAGFRIHRGLTSLGPYTPISSFIPSGTDPFMGYFYQYEDDTVEIGVQYYYVLEIINSDGTSEYTAPVDAIIPAPTQTSTVTFTVTAIISYTSTATATQTQTVTPSAMNAAIYSSHTPTITVTSQPTASSTSTPTTTLEPFAQREINFPVLIPTRTTTPEESPLTPGSENLPIISEDQVTAKGDSLPIVILVVIIWLVLALFILLYVKRISGDGKTKH